MSRIVIYSPLELGIPGGCRFGFTIPRVARDGSQVILNLNQEQEIVMKKIFHWFIFAVAVLVLGYAFVILLF